MTADRFAAARLVADAVLYEGYVLYPYRASARKNQLRWQFGVLVPPACSAADPSERSSMRTECLVDPTPDAGAGAGPGLLTLRLRCLQVQHRSVEVVDEQAVATLGEPLIPWDEAVEQVVDLPPVLLTPSTGDDVVFPLQFPLAVDAEDVRTPAGRVAARLVRRRLPVIGEVRVRTEVVGALVKVAVTVANTGEVDIEVEPGRDAMLQRSLVAVHTMLAVDRGSFLSLIDPPARARAAVDGCTSDGTFPVLIGPADATDVLLSSPIILHDHPAVAPESPGDLYDATEIDEILALRVLTLTDAEKAEARATDPRAAAIVDRVEQMPPELWGRLHGAARAFDTADVTTWTTPTFSHGEPGSEPEPEAPWWDPSVDAAVDPWTDTVDVAGHTVGEGTRVRLHPSHRADAQDLFLAGLTGTVAGVFHDVDGGRHLAVTLDDDPGADLHAWQGRYRYFAPDEVEVLTQRPETTGSPETTEREAAP